MKRITITIAGKSYNVNIDNEYADELEKEIFRELKKEGNNTPKEILGAYLKKSYECYNAKRKIEKILSKIENI
jgi:hypothetical protein